MYNISLSFLDIHDHKILIYSHTKSIFGKNYYFWLEWLLWNFSSTRTNLKTIRIFQELVINILWYGIWKFPCYFQLGHNTFRNDTFPKFICILKKKNPWNTWLIIKVGISVLIDCYVMFVFLYFAVNVGQSLHGRRSGSNVILLIYVGNNINSACEKCGFIGTKKKLLRTIRKRQI